MMGQLVSGNATLPFIMAFLESGGEVWITNLELDSDSNGEKEI